MKTRTKGWTLVELLTTVAVSSVVLGIAVPALGGMVAEARRVSAVNGLVASFNHARHAAVMERRIVSVCPSADAIRCGDDWRQGWIVFKEPRRWRRRDAVPPAALIDHRTAPRGQLRITGNRTRFRFRPHGVRATNGTVLVCTERHGTAVVIAPSGRIRTDRNRTCS